MNKRTIKEQLIALFSSGEIFSLQKIYEEIDEKEHSIRARIYENIGILFERVSEGVYQAKDAGAILIEGDGRNLSFLKDDSIDVIITDHPWEDALSNKGGNRNFANYNTFEYTKKDFEEKARVLKDGCFLIEILPLENANNFDYLYKLKKLAEESGFKYYSKIPWVKGNFVSNTGRNSKNAEDIMIFTKGKARSLRLNAKKNKAEINKDIIHYMSGTSKMLPTKFDHQPPSYKERIQKSQKPVSLFEDILDYVSLKGEVVLDQFAGSGSVGLACINKNRKNISIELDSNSFKSMAKRYKGEKHIIIKNK